MSVALDSLRAALGLGTDEPTPATITVEQTAECLSIARGTAYAGVRDGSIPSVRIGRRILIPTGRLLALLEGPPGQGQPSGDGADDGSPGLVVQQGSPASNGGHAGQPPVQPIPWAGGSSPTEGSR